jgi:hypothetical protein
MSETQDATAHASGVSAKGSVGTATAHGGLSLPGCCPATAAAIEIRDAAERASADADAEAATAAENVDYWRAMAADPVRVAEDNIDPGEVQRALRKADEMDFSAKVKANTRRIELDQARAKVRECAEHAAEVLGARARARLADIHSRQDSARAEMQRAAAEEVELVQEVNNALRPIFGYDKGAGDLGITLRVA